MEVSLTGILVHPSKDVELKGHSQLIAAGTWPAKLIGRGRSRSAYEPTA